MFFLKNFHQIQLDIVGIVAILGEGSIIRNAQVSALTWHHIFPRILPAPQALIRHERPARLPTEQGIVIGAYSGNLRFELNFFAALVHNEEKEKNTTRLVVVSKKKDVAGKNIPDKKPYGSKGHGHLLFLSLLGTAFSIVLAWLAVHQDDGFALVATILLSLTSTVVGMASWWNLELEEETTKIAKQDEKEKTKIIPDGDVVIYYPRVGAFLVVRCESDAISRLYFRIERCKYTFGDNQYRALAFLATLLLIAGLVCLGNSKPILQISFAASYILLNLAYWLSSALNPVKHHWSHNYDVTEKDFEMPSQAKLKFKRGINKVMKLNQKTSPNQLEMGQPPLEGQPSAFDAPNFIRRLTASLTTKLTSKYSQSEERVMPKSEWIYTDALWAAIALVGHDRWLEGTSIAPNNTAWKQWCTEAGNFASSRDEDQNICLPEWDHRDRIRVLLERQPDKGFAEVVEEILKKKKDSKDEDARKVEEIARLKMLITEVLMEQTQEGPEAPQRATPPQPPSAHSFGDTLSMAPLPPGPDN